MNYAILITFAFALLISTTKAWDCAVHLIIMKIALTEMSNDERTKLETILTGLSSGIGKQRTIEAACFQEDMGDAGFTALDLWKSYETPFYDGITKEAASYQPHNMNASHGIVSVFAYLEKSH